jgi:hypothetical protein
MIMAVIIGDKYCINDNDNCLQATEKKTGLSILYIPAVSPDYGVFSLELSGSSDVDSTVKRFLKMIDGDTVEVSECQAI